MFCKNCGKEIEENLEKCPYCDSQAKPNYILSGTRRNMRGKKWKIGTDVYVEGDKVKTDTYIITTTYAIKDKSKSEFYKNDVENITLPLFPFLRVTDIICMIVYILMMFISYGMGIFFVLYAVKVVTMRHIKIKLKNGRTIKIPICQKADASEFLKELNYPLEEIETNNSKMIESKKWLFRDGIITLIMFLIAVAMTAFGMERCGVYGPRNLNEEKKITEETSDEEEYSMEEGDSADQENTEEITVPITVVNNTGVDIWKIYASITNTDDWEEDILGDSILYDDAECVINFKFGYDQLVWDFAIADSENNRLEYYDIDFSNCSIEGATLVFNADGTAYLE